MPSATPDHIHHPDVSVLTPAVSLQEASKHFYKGNVSLHVPRDSFVSIVGPGGYGKFTIPDVIVRTERPSSGTVYCNGDKVDRLPAGCVAALTHSPSAAAERDIWMEVPCASPT